MHRSRLWRAVVLCAAALGALALPVVAPRAAVDASPASDELRERLEQQERATNRLDDELAGLRGQRDRAEQRLAEIAVRLEDARSRLVHAEGQVALAELALDDAVAEQERTDRVHRDAQTALAATADRLDGEREVLAGQVVHAFKLGTVGATRGAMVLEVLRRADDPNAFAVAMRQLQVVIADQDATVARVDELRAEHEADTEAAALARRDAVQSAADAAATLRTVEELREEAARLAAEVADEEAEQRAVLASLRLTESETAELLEQASARASVLRGELAAQLAREEAARRRAANEAGRLGLPGAGGAATPPGGVVCPVLGAVAGRDVTNDWGFPRSGGRTHQGNDIFAARGTPVLAVGDGEVVRINPPSAPTRLGGITVTYRTIDGSRWYNAHLDTIAAGITPGVRVVQGEVIGTVGSTGNARTTPPHLHLGRQLPDGAWVNPWPTISPVCR